MAAPDPRTAKPDELLTYLETLSDVEAARWVTANFSKIPAGYAADIQGKLLLADGRSKTYKAFEAFEDSAKGASGGSNDVVADRHQLDSVTPPSVADDELDAMTAEIVATGVDPKTARARAERTQGEMRGELVPIPDQILAAYGRREPSSNQKQDLIQAWNDLNPEAPVRTWNDLAKAMNAVPGDPFNEEVVSYAVTGMEPQRVFEMEIVEPGRTLAPGIASHPQTTTMRISENQLSAMQQIYGSGFSTRDVKLLAQTASRIGLRDALGQNSGWMVLASGAAAMGMWNIGQRTADAQAVAATNTIDPRSADALSAASFVATNRATQSSTAITKKEMERLKNWGLKFKSGMTIYGQNETLSFLHAMNPSLAANVATTEYDKLSMRDRKQAQSFMMMGGFSPAQLGELGYGWAAGFDEIEVNRLAAEDAGGGGRQGPIRSLPDPEQIRQSAKDMYRQLFAMDPSDAQLNQLVGSVTASLNSADVDGADGVVQDVNAGSQIRKELEGSAEYRDLYGKRPSGMTEEEYQNQFRAGAASILGNAAARPDVIRAGMRSGDYNTSVGAAAMTTEAWEGSSFLGRLAQAAQLVNENT